MSKEIDEQFDVQVEWGSADADADQTLPGFVRVYNGGGDKTSALQIWQKEQFFHVDLNVDQITTLIRWLNKAKECIGA